jgi:hypothetical protein
VRHRWTYRLTVGTSSGFLSNSIARTSIPKEWELDCKALKKVPFSYSVCASKTKPYKMPKIKLTDHFIRLNNIRGKSSHRFFIDRRGSWQGIGKWLRVFSHKRFCSDCRFDSSTKFPHTISTSLFPFTIGFKGQDTVHNPWRFSSLRHK